MSLFQRGDFCLASGRRTNWKIECDELNAGDWDVLAMLIAERATFSEVIGVPRGGVPLAQALFGYCGEHGPRLVVDDVLTTGGSILKSMDRPDDVGFVVFARGPLPERISALFQMTLRDAA